MSEAPLTSFFAFTRFGTASDLDLDAHFFRSGMPNMVLYIMPYVAYVLSAETGVGRLGFHACRRFPAMAGSARAHRGGRQACLARASLSRRSSVVEHVIGNDGVSSSILLGGTIILPEDGKAGAGCQRRAAISPASRRKPSASAARPVSSGRSCAHSTL